VSAVLSLSWHLLLCDIAQRPKPRGLVLTSGTRLGGNKRCAKCLDPREQRAGTPNSSPCLVRPSTPAASSQAWLGPQRAGDKFGNDSIPWSGRIPTSAAGTGWVLWLSWRTEWQSSANALIPWERQPWLLCTRKCSSLGQWRLLIPGGKWCKKCYCSCV
jgi:hypothetical protein